jgi:hypothetical protein
MHATFVPWTLEEIHAWLFAREGSVFLKDGQPVVDFPESNCDRYGLRDRRENLLAEVLPHLRARRAEIIESLTRAKREADADKFDADDADAIERIREDVRNEKRLSPEERESRDRKAAEESRAEIIRQLRAFAHESGKPLWWMALTPKLVMRADGLTTIPDEALYASVEGGEGWVNLPKIDVASKPKRSRMKRKKWNRAG